jgi:hypothetical protein
MRPRYRTIAELSPNRALKNPTFDSRETARWSA